MKILKTAMIALAATVAATGSAAILETPAYKWVGDSIIQGEYMAYAPDDVTIISTYSAQPHYFMPIEKKWTLKNDISQYPRLKTSNRLHNAIYNMGLDEMINAVEPDTTLRTGKEWAGVWTRDVSYSIILSMAYLQPEASRISLMKKVNPNGRIIQDTGSGGAWPVSSDRMIWAVAAYELYKVTGDSEWLKYIYPIIKNSIEDDFEVTFVDGRVNGETSFMDWREQSYPQWMQTADIYSSQAQNTGAVHVQALRVLADIAKELGYKDDAAKYADRAEALNNALVDYFWSSEHGYLYMYNYGRDFPMMNPRSETLGQSFAILFDQLEPEKALSITENVPVTPYGPGIFFPQIKDQPAYHNNGLWPFVASYWTLANAHAGNEEGTLQGIGSVFRPAALFATNKENFNLDNGDIATELNSSNMLWSLSGNLAITYRVLFGIIFEKDGLAFRPFIPKALADTRSIEGFKYRNATLNVTINGYGNEIKSFTVNGKKQKDAFIPANAKGTLDIVIEMADNDLPDHKVNNMANVKAPLTPIARLYNDPALDGEGVPVNNRLEWNPIEYIAGYIVYKDGKPYAETRETTIAATEPGEYVVVGIDSNGVPSFASEPRSNRPEQRVKPQDLAITAVSSEISYPAEQPIKGYTGAGFAETDHKRPTVTFEVIVPEAGTYAMQVRYANGNGPVNTENKCAIRSVMVDGHKVGTVVMPHRGVGNWYDWGMSNVVRADLKAGVNTITLSLQPYDENMNIATNHALVDYLVLRRLGD